MFRNDLRQMRILTLLAISMPAWLSACGLPEDPARSICDGSGSLRFALATSGGSLEPGGDFVWSEIGTSFVYVDGQCRYWVKGSPSGETRIGSLSAEQEAALMQQTVYRSWQAINGDWTGERFSDMWGFNLWDSDFLIRCGPRCDRAGAPQQLAELEPAKLLQPLWEQGTPLEEEGVRFVLVQYATNARTALTWPLDQPMEAFVWDEEHRPPERGDTTLVTGEDARRLRALRATHAASDSDLSAPIPIQGTEGRIYSLFMRDAIPLENEQGLIPTPPW